MIHYPHFKQVLRTTLEQMAAYKPQAEMAITMAVAHESDKGKYWEQLGGGPALGIIQMEPFTHDSIWANADNIKYNAAKAKVVKDVEQLRYCMKYNIFMARSMFLMDKSPFPLTKEKMAIYLKEYYNTATGKAKPEDYLNSYMEWVYK